MVARPLLPSRCVATCKPGKPGLTSFSETLALFFIRFLSFRKMKVQDGQNGPSCLPEKTGWLRACLLQMDPHLLDHALSCSLCISVSRLIALRSWRLCHPRSLIIISEKLDFYDNRFSHSVQLCIGLSLVLPHQLFR